MVNKICVIAGTILLVARGASATSDIAMNDWTGQAQVNIRTCDPVGPSENPEATCGTPSTGGLMGDGFVVVGGGGWVTNDSDPGALLTASFPDFSGAPNNLKTWIARSKDHRFFYSHRLQAYSIGLSLQGVSAATLRSNNNIKLFKFISGAAQHPSITAFVDAGYTLIGGGTRATYNGAGVMLTDSRPRSGGWYGAAKDQQLADASGQVTVWAIGIRSTLLTSRGLVAITRVSPGTHVASGWGADQSAADSGFVLTAAGGQSTYNGVGRLLTGIIPFQYLGLQFVWNQSVDHGVADSGDTISSLIAIGGG